MRCLVTGGAGFIGSNLVDALIARGDEVIVLDNLSTGKKENINVKATLHVADIKNLSEIKPLFNGVDFVFHVAALPRVQYSVDFPFETNENNISGSLNVLLAARDAKVKRLVYSASSSAYGSQKMLPLKESMAAMPLSPYAIQKYVVEHYAAVFSSIYGLPTVSLRYFNVYGPRQASEGAYATAISVFMRQKANGEKLTITGDGEQTRDFTHVSDIVRANMLAAESDRVGSGEVINIGSGKNWSINKVASLVGGEIAYVPARPGEARDSLADIGQARELLGWQPLMPLEDGIKALLV